jgi:hypothetical protein
MPLSTGDLTPSPRFVTPSLGRLKYRLFDDIKIFLKRLRGVNVSRATPANTLKNEK